MINRINHNDQECMLMAWEIKTGLPSRDYDRLKAIYLEKTGKTKYVFNYMWYDHTKIKNYIEDVGILLSRKRYETQADLQEYWRHIETRIDNFEGLYGVTFHRDLPTMLS